ncbi:MAG: hypothetical protein ACKOJB_10475, partial [Chthoniobacterales bacterium]
QCIDEVFGRVTRGGEHSHVDIHDIPPISGTRTFFEGQKQGDVLVMVGYTSRGLDPSLLLRHLRFAPEIFCRLQTDLASLIAGISASQLVGLHVRAACVSMNAPDYAGICSYVNAVSGRILIVATDLESEELKIKKMLGDKMRSCAKHFPKQPTTIAGCAHEPLALHRIAFDPKSLASPGGLTSADIAYQALLDWCAVASCSRIFYQPESTFSHLTNYFGRAQPWSVTPHGQARLKQRAAGHYRAALKWAVRPGLIPGLSGAEAGL